MVETCVITAAGQEGGGAAFLNLWQVSWQPATICCRTTNFLSSQNKSSRRLQSFKNVIWRDFILSSNRISYGDDPASTQFPYRLTHTMKGEERASYKSIQEGSPGTGEAAGAPLASVEWERKVNWQRRDPIDDQSPSQLASILQQNSPSPSTLFECNKSMDSQPQIRSHSMNRNKGVLLLLKFLFSSFLLFFLVSRLCHPPIQQVNQCKSLRTRHQGKKCFNHVADCDPRVGNFFFPIK